MAVITVPTTKPRRRDLVAAARPSRRRISAWEARKAQLRESILFNSGLLPMPAKTPLNPIVAGRLERDDYVIERIAIETLPGYWLGGNLYLPKSPKGRVL